MDAVDALLERLEAPFDIADAPERNYFIELPIDVAHAVAAGELPRHHEDPFNRILVAQACTEGLTIGADDATSLKAGPGEARRLPYGD